MNRFRYVYHRICAFELDDKLRKTAKNCPDLKESSHAVFYGYIDPQKGLMLELLGAAKPGKTRLNEKEPYQGERVSISITQVGDKFPISYEFNEKSKYAPRVEALNIFNVSDEIEASRDNEEIDQFRDEQYPDRIYVRLLKGDLDREKVPVEITGMTNWEFLGKIVKSPRQDFGLKKGDELRFTIQRGDDYKPLDCIADLDEDSGNLKNPSGSRRKYIIRNRLVSFSERVILSIGSADVYNYALDINNLAPIRDVSIENITLDPIKNILLKVNCESDLFDPYEYAIQKEIRAKDKITFDIPLTVHHNKLMALTEAVKVNCRIELLSSDSEEPICPPIKWDMDVLAYNQWAGFNYARFLPAFVMPNRPYIKELQNIAVSRLKAQGLHTMLEGYQSGDENRVRELASALYAAVQKKNISYSNPPASFGMESGFGQRIRIGDQVIEERLGIWRAKVQIYSPFLIF